VFGRKVLQAALPARLRARFAPERGAGGAPVSPPAPSWWLTRFLILRLLGFVYLSAFLSLALEVRPLLGHDGLVPADLCLERLAQSAGSRWAGPWRHPTLFWIASSDGALVGLAWLGTALSLVVACGFANAILLAALWAVYLSFVKVGPGFLDYGFDLLLAETGFLAIFLCPLLDARPFPRLPPPAPVLWLLRWLLLRLLLGAGLIKLRRDPCWRDLSCLDTYFETQPLPNPLSAAFHFLPSWVHRPGVLFSHFVELVASWLVLAPRTLRRAAGAIQLLFQVLLILSGSLGFLNWLTAVPILACFDDALLARILPRRLVLRAERAAAEARACRGQTIAVSLLVALVLVLGLAPVRNLLSPGQRMNASFDRLALVNSYGAFAKVARERAEIVFEGTDEVEIGADTAWREYALPCKPGDVRRRPCWIAPLWPRLDLRFWYAAKSEPGQHLWTLHFAWKLLHGDRGTLELLAGDPFPEQPPRYVRARLYRYSFAPRGNPTGVVWRRELLREWLPPVALDDARLRRVLAASGWLRPGPARGPR